MNLFEDIALFDEGKRRFTNFQLPDTDLRLWEQFFSKVEADRYYTTLKDTTPWEQRERKLYDKVVSDPRLTAFYIGGGEAGIFREDIRKKDYLTLFYTRVKE